MMANDQKKKKGLTRLNYGLEIAAVHRYQPTSDEVITQPNESFTLREILEKYQRGSGELLGNDPIFEDPSVTEALGSRTLDLNRMTKVEKAQFALDLKEKIDAESKKIVAAKKKTYQKNLQKFIEDKVQSIIDKKTTPPADETQD